MNADSALADHPSVDGVSPRKHDEKDTSITVFT
jgi:hypothetical protein